ncbi:MAG: hypothetical protein QM661_01270 [Solimonas sp.]
MEVLLFVSFILWSTGLCTAALVVIAITDWRIERRSQQFRISSPAPLQQKLHTPATTAEPALLKAA